jgi:hypothetical protein
LVGGVKILTYLREEGVVVAKAVRLLIIISRAADIEGRDMVRVNEPAQPINIYSDLNIAWHTSSGSHLDKPRARSYSSFLGEIRRASSYQQRRFHISCGSCQYIEQLDRYLTDQVALVTRGMRFSGAILDSSMGILLRWPGSSSHSTECAMTELMSTSPPK